MPYQGVEFDQDKEIQSYKSRTILGEAKTPGLVAWLRNHSGGLIKSDRQSAHILLTIAIVAFILSLFFWFGIL